MSKSRLPTFEEALAVLCEGNHGTVYIELGWQHRIKPGTKVVITEVRRNYSKMIAIELKPEDEK